MHVTFLAVAGFLVGAILYLGWYTTRFEPETKLGYAIVGIGVIITVTINTWVGFIKDTSNWFRSMTLLGYLIIIIGLIILVRERRQHYNRRNDPTNEKLHS